MKTEFLRQRLIRSTPVDLGDMPPPINSNDGEAEISLRELLRIFQRQLRFILIVVAILTAPVALIAYWLEQKYTAVASVLVEPLPLINPLADVSTAAQRPDPAYLETMASVIRSSAFTSQIMETLGLFSDPEFVPNAIPISGNVGLPSPSGSGSSEDPQNATILAIDRLEPMAVFDERLQVSPQSQSYVIRINFTSQDPNKAALIANSVAQQFIDMQLAEKSAAVQRAIAGISGQLGVAELALRRAEQAVEEIRRGHNILSASVGPVSHMQTAEIARTLVQTRANYALVKAKLEVIAAIQANKTGVEDLAEVTSSPVVGQLRLHIVDIEARLQEASATYGEQHALTNTIRKELETTDRKLFEEVGRIYGGVEHEATIIANQIIDLERQLAEAEELSALESVTATRLENAESDVIAKRTIYEALLQRQEEAKVQERWLTPDVRLMSAAAAPLEMSTPSPAKIVLAGFGVALVLALLLAFLREQMDGSLRSNRQVEKELGVACLGLIPEIGDQPAGQTPLVLRAPRSSFAQSVGAVWAQMQIALPTAKVVLVTSALPNEGSSSLAENLACCAYQSDGMLTALVDFDLWCSREEGLVDRNDTPGISDMLRHDTSHSFTLKDIARSDPETGVDVFPVGKRLTGGVELSGSGAVSGLIDDLRKQYDMVIIDAPPLLGVSDARRLAYYADAALLAIRWGTTRRDVASSALQTLMQSKAQVVGAVLTKVDAKRQSLYGRGDGVQYGDQFKRYHSA
ncbi:polysaccharide biosynthesis tyrosine autokinase [Aliiroseovarius sp. KMU-50]|uniref:Polysaccharide biosynthesis tyrosine autokinase n=1 Tax=Aliiroseovarius salicola TaxID=3009082 RepID=A0ABT4W2K2_9RHOB|nr:polysaccharide biosynthesis tyrosine autokinase [Aliiroseovarius sp. KMU-50]MDA5094654.1 polysaccharide biosynthesis tyrosine autokinase [Aliiroseovarius sp. KMU-50]